MTQHAEYRFSATVETDDEALLNCLRALSQYAQRTGNLRIPWGGTKKEDWARANNRATFRFSQSNYRTLFLDSILRLLPKDLYQIVATQDNDPASPQGTD